MRIQSNLFYEYVDGVVDRIQSNLQNHSLETHIQGSPQAELQANLQDHLQTSEAALSSSPPQNLSSAVTSAVSSTLSDMKTQVSNSVTATWDEANTLLDSGVNQVGGFTQSMVDQVIQAIALRIQGWLDMHPFIAWVLHHPLLSGLGLLIIIFLLWSLLQTLLLLTQNLWAKILQLPLMFGLLIVRGIVALFKRLRRRLLHSKAMQHQALHSQSDRPNHSAQYLKLPQPNSLGPVIPDGYRPDSADADVMALFIRLEELSREQNQILKQLTARLQHQIADH